MDDRKYNLLWQSCLHAKREYDTVVFSYRAIFPVYALIVLYETALSPLLTLCRESGLMLHPLEPFLVICANPFSALIIPVMLLLLLSGFPTRESQNGFFLVRSSRCSWTSGEILFVLMLSVSVMILVFLFSCIILFPVCAWDAASFNTWSPLLLNLRVESPELYDSYSRFLLLPETTTQGSPLVICLHSLAWMLLSTLLQGMTQLCFAMYDKRSLGFVALLGINGAGFALLHLQSEWKWVFPLPHTMFGLHFSGLFAQPLFPVGCSYSYFFIMITVLFAVAVRRTIHMDFFGKE